MKLKFIVHEAEEDRYWAKVPAILGCATKVKHLKNFCIIYMKQLKAV